MQWFPHLELLLKIIRSIHVVIIIVKYASQIAQLLENAFPICICISRPKAERNVGREITTWTVYIYNHHQCKCKCMLAEFEQPSWFSLHLNKIIALNASLCDNCAGPLNLDAKFAYAFSMIRAKIATARHLLWHVSNYHLIETTASDYICMFTVHSHMEHSFPP